MELREGRSARLAVAGPTVATAMVLRSEARESIVRDPLPGCGGGDEESRAGTDARVSVEGSHADPKRIAKPGLAA